MNGKEFENLVRKVLQTDAKRLPVGAVCSLVRIYRNIYRFARIQGMHSIAGNSPAVYSDAARALAAPLKRRLHSQKLSLRERLEVLIALRDIAEIWVTDDALLQYADRQFDELFDTVDTKSADDDVAVRLVALACRADADTGDAFYTSRLCDLIAGWSEMSSLSVRQLAERTIAVNSHSRLISDSGIHVPSAVRTVAREFSGEKGPLGEEDAETLLSCYHCLKCNSEYPADRSLLHALARRLYAQMDQTVEKRLVSTQDARWYPVAEVVIDDYCESRMDISEHETRVSMA